MERHILNINSPLQAYYSRKNKFFRSKTLLFSSQEVCFCVVKDRLLQCKRPSFGKPEKTKRSLFQGNMLSIKLLTKTSKIFDF